jgi:hypothetical protein
LEKREKFGGMMRPSLARALRTRAAQNDQQLSDVLEAACEAYLGWAESGAGVPAPNPDGVGLGQGTEYNSDVVSTLNKIHERSPVVARALRAAINATAVELLIGKTDSDAPVPDNATIERLAQETDEAVRDAEQAVARAKADRRPTAKRTG